ncbi:uncharacterized protein LOC136025405 isoform X2 [Artemia franciscana]|uniref:uncharacterized protein LOC136025405 isoform X2 n=1 Tax=Artemia franciscana TaxID=6661 RepID=UPI0032DB270E
MEEADNILQCHPGMTIKLASISYLENNKTERKHFVLSQRSQPKGCEIVGEVKWIHIAPVVIKDVDAKGKSLSGYLDDKIRHLSNREDEKVPLNTVIDFVERYVLLRVPPNKPLIISAGEASTSVLKDAIFVLYNASRLKVLLGNCAQRGFNFITGSMLEDLDNFNDKLTEVDVALKVFTSDFPNRYSKWTRDTSNGHLVAHLIIRWCQEFVRIFNKFYNTVRVLPPEKMQEHQASILRQRVHILGHLLLAVEKVFVLLNCTIPMKM